MDESQPAKAYGEGRIRHNVTYGDVERAAIAILKSERRPTIETVREALGGGSPDTIGNALRRFWRDLGARIDGDPAALTRMPVDIAELADGMWQRALKLAAESAHADDNAARERLRQLEAETSIKQHSFMLREREIDAQARERERALAEARDHLISLSKALAREQATNASQQQRISSLEQQVAANRGQLATLIAAAITRNRAKRPVLDKGVPKSIQKRATPITRGLGRPSRAKTSPTTGAPRKPGRTSPVKKPSRLAPGRR